MHKVHLSAVIEIDDSSFGELCKRFQISSNSKYSYTESEDFYFLLRTLLVNELQGRHKSADLDVAMTKIESLAESFSKLLTDVLIQNNKDIVSALGNIQHAGHIEHAGHSGQISKPVQQNPVTPVETKTIHEVKPRQEPVNSEVRQEASAEPKKVNPLDIARKVKKISGG